MGGWNPKTGQRRRELTVRATDFVGGVLAIDVAVAALRQKEASAVGATVLSIRRASLTDVIKQQKISNQAPRKLGLTTALTWAIAFVAVVAAVEFAVAQQRLVQAQFTVGAAKPGGQVAAFYHHASARKRDESQGKGACR